MTKEWNTFNLDELALKIFPKPMTFSTYEQAQDYYYSKHTCDSDDADREVAKIVRWMEQEGHILADEETEHAYKEHQLI